MPLKGLFNFNSEKRFPVWNVQFYDETLLYRVDKLNYRIIRQGTLNAILSHPMYMLVHEDILRCLNLHMDHPIDSERVNIYDHRSKRHHTSYYLITAPPITPATMHQNDHNGYQVWIDEVCGCFFVSRLMKEVLEQLNLKNVNYYAGYSMIGG